MQLKVFLACSIDSGGMHWKLNRETLVKLCEDCGCEVMAAGEGQNPIISSSAPKSLCKIVMNHDLTEQRKAHVTLVATELEEFSVGTWIEMWEAYKLGQYIILFVACGFEAREVRSVFLRGLADEIITDRDLDALESRLRELQEGV